MQNIITQLQVPNSFRFQNDNSIELISGISNCDDNKDDQQNHTRIPPPSPPKEKINDGIRSSTKRLEKRVGNSLKEGNISKPDQREAWMSPSMMNVPPGKPPENYWTYKAQLSPSHLQMAAAAISISLKLDIVSTVIFQE